MMRLFRFWLLMVGGLVFCTPAYAAVLDIKEIKSKSGLTAWLVEDHSIPVISLQFSFRNSGAKHDPADKQGLARLASNTMDEGAGDILSEEFQKTLNDLSISLSFSSSRDTFGGQVKTLSKNKNRAFELLSLAVTSPRFDDEPLQRMKQANQARIRSSLSDPNWIAARIMNDRAYAGHPYALNSGGTLASLETITPDDLRGFHKTLSRDKLVIAASGDITAEELSIVIDRIFGALPAVSIAPVIAESSIQNQGQNFIFAKDIPQTIIEIMQPGIDILSPDYQTAQVMNFILGSSGFGSRLTEEIREKRGLTYGIYSSLDDTDHVDTLSISTSTENKNVAEMMTLIKTEWHKIKTEPVNEKELADAQSYLIGSLPLALTSTDKIAGLLLSLQVDNLPIDYLDKRKQAIENITTIDIQTVAQKILDENKFVTVFVGAPENILSGTKISEVPNAQ